jgi:hypothetical protein
MESEKKEEPLKLRDDVSKAYDVAPGKVRKFYSGKFGYVDMNQVTLGTAKKLAEAGYLVPKAADKKG